MELLPCLFEFLGPVSVPSLLLFYRREGSGILVREKTRKRDGLVLEASECQGSRKSHDAEWREIPEKRMLIPLDQFVG